VQEPVQGPPAPQGRAPGVPVRPGPKPEYGLGLGPEQKLEWVPRMGLEPGQLGPRLKQVLELVSRPVLCLRLKQEQEQEREQAHGLRSQASLQLRLKLKTIQEQEQE